MQQMTGLTGAPVHAGSWFGLPDFGVTEVLGGLLGQPQTSQGGSNISTGGALTQTYWDPAATNNVANTQQSQNALNVLGTRTSAPTPPPAPAPTNNNNNNNNNQGGGAKDPNSIIHTPFGDIPLRDAMKNWGYDANGNPPNQQNQVDQWQNQISSAYQPAVDQINAYIAQLPGQQQAIQENLNKQQATQQGDILGQANLSRGNLANQQTDFEQQAQKQWEAANQMYNFAENGMYNQYGGGEAGSAGPAFQRQFEVLQRQKFAQLEDTKQRAELQFKQASSTIDTQLMAAHNDLAQKYTDATVQLNDEFNQRTQALQTAANMTQAEKTNAMINNLQQTIANAQNVAATFNAAKLQLGAIAAQTYAIYAARGFQTPDMQQFFQGIQGISGVPSVGQAVQPTGNIVQNIVGSLYGPRQYDQNGKPT